MEHRMDQAQASGSYLTETSIFRQAPPLSFQPGIEVALPYSEPSGSQLDHEGASRVVPGGQKRRVRKPTQTPEEKRKKKIEADRNYRRKHRDEVNELRAMKSRVERAGNRFGGIEEMESKLHIFEQIESMLGGIDESEMVTEINRLKNIEFRYSKYQQVESSLNHQNAQPVFGVLQQNYQGMQPVNCYNHVQVYMTYLPQDYHGMQSVSHNNQELGSIPELSWSQDLDTVADFA